MVYSIVRVSQVGVFSHTSKHVSRKLNAEYVSTFQNKNLNVLRYTFAIPVNYC